MEQAELIKIRYEDVKIVLKSLCPVKGCNGLRLLRGLLLIPPGRLRSLSNTLNYAKPQESKKWV